MKLPTLALKKKTLLVVKSALDDDLDSERVVAKRKLVIREDDAADNEVLQELEEEASSGEFRAEFVRERPSQRRPSRTIEIDALDPEKVYGIEFTKRGTYNVSQIRPATGLEIKRRWKELLHFAIVQYFPGNPIRRGFRILLLPNQVCVGICDWDGDDYEPEVVPVLKKKIKIRFKKRK